MAWQAALSGEAFRDWLRTIAGGAQVSQGQRLDPFVQSMRNFKEAPEWLAMVEAGETLPARGGSGHQAETDLTGAGLTAGDRSNLTLTDLGRAALSAWRSAGVDDSDGAHELSRCVALIERAVALGVTRYLAMLHFWRELRASTDIDDLLASAEVLYLASYLNRSESGYNPWQVLSALETDLRSVAPVNWAALSTEVARGDTDVDQALSKLQEAVSNWASRGDPRITFCMAMELHELSREDMALVDGALDRWEVRDG
ncbi:MAG: hypothetical protein ACRD2X_09630 [Vicinamibacteraceae bacterium]